MSWRRAMVGTVAVVLITVGLPGCGDQENYGQLELSGRESLESELIPLYMGAVDPGSAVGRLLRDDSWHAPERRADGGTHAWTRATDAMIRLPIEVVGAGELVLRGYGLPMAAGPRRLEVLVNGYSLGEQDLPTSIGELRFVVGPHRLRSGLNEVRLVVDRTVAPSEIGRSQDTRALGVLVDGLQFVPGGAPLPADPYDAGTVGDDVRWCLPLYHAAGAHLTVTWAEGDQLFDAYAVAELPGGRPEYQGSLKDSGHSAELDLPADLGAGRWLMLQGGAEVQKLSFERRMRALDVILIVIDTLRPDYLGCYGGQRAATPAIDALAADGILFETALCHSPITGPSHSSLFSSRYPSETGVVNNSRRPLPRSLPLLAEILTEAGYRSTAAIGIGPVRAVHGFGRGFASYDDRMGDLWILPAQTVFPRAVPLLARSDGPSFTWIHFADPHEPYNAHGLVERTAEVLIDGKIVATVPTSTYTPTRLPVKLRAGATELLLRSEDPFTIRNLGLRLVDGMRARLDPPLPPPAAVPQQSFSLLAEEAGTIELVLHLADRIDSNADLLERYAREVAYTDGFVGMVIDSLKAADRYDDSLIIFAGDHGEALGAHGWVGHVETLYDAMVRVPLIIKPPGAADFQPGTRRTDQAALVDLLPSILAQLALPPLPEARGRDLLAPDAAQQSTAVFLETHRPEAQRDLYGLRSDTHKLIHEPETDTWELYDLRADPDELNDLVDSASAADGEARARYRDVLLALMAVMNLGESSTSTDVEIDAHTAEMLRSLGY